MAAHFFDTPDPGPRLLYQDASGALSPTPPADSNAALATQLRGNLSGALKGDLPPDVVRQIQQNAAEFGVSGGLSGSQFAGYQGLKNLGLTSLSRAQQAEQELVNPLLGYHPLQILPQTNNQPYQPPSNINWAQSTSPAGVGAINSGGGRQMTQPAPLQDPRAAWAQQTGQDQNVNGILAQLASKYGNLGAQGGSGFGFASPAGGTLPSYGTGSTGDNWWQNAGTGEAPSGSISLGGYGDYGGEAPVPQYSNTSPVYDPLASDAEAYQYAGGDIYG